MTIAHLHQVTPAPLCWPENKPRAARRIGSPFKQRTLTTVLDDVRRELRRWGALDHKRAIDG